ncbi:exodeoxyribonuclease V subunit alpha [Comamonas sp. MYb21]|uniref:exodeoxyribonuclease V subunit alpha n=1 Tax=Comamonas sp. MYb21 TaxID=1848648 RepID=UPI0030ADB143
MTTEPQDGLPENGQAQDGLPTQRSAARTLAVPNGATASLLHTVERWTAHGWLRSLDQALVLFLHELDPAASPLVLLAAALASHQLGRGHVCLDLQATLDNSRFALSLPPDTVAQGSGATEPTPLPLPSELLAQVNLLQWQSALQASALVAAPGKPSQGGTPLVLQGDRLYLRRYWQYEQDVAQAIGQRITASQHLRQGRSAAQDAMLRQALDQLFPPAGDQIADLPDWQKMACALAASSAFSIITGGPGTGKTTTVVKLLALLQSMALQQNGRPLRICLAAPTGKAAARLSESIVQALQRLGDAQLPAVPPAPGSGEARSLKPLIPSDAQTLHRLLGSRPDSRHFRHDAQHPLALDVLVVDEASMVDLEMMAALLSALPAQARLVLLGDKDQLASVEAGAVLGELCAQSERGLYWHETAQWLQQVTGQQVPAELQDMAGKPLDQAVAMLRVSHRFHADSGIGQLAGVVNAGRRKAIKPLLKAGYPDLAAYAVPDLTHSSLAQLVLDGGGKRFVDSAAKRDAGPVGYGHYLHVLREMPANPSPEALNPWALRLLKAHGEFQVLCALRSGPWGVEGLNERIAQLLAHRELIAQSSGWYAGRPVLVTRNDYSLKLMNGDIGITVQMPAGQALDAGGGSGAAVAQGALRVVFATSEGLRWVLPSRLQAVETVYAMTIHKSQGSEFSHAAVVLPPSLSPIMTRELVYTGLTRAKRWLTVVAGGSSNFAVLEEATERQVRRSSGLRQGEL